MKVSLVPQQHIGKAWVSVRTILKPGIDASKGRYTTDNVFASLMRGEQQLWIAFTDDGICAAATTAIVDYPSKRVLSGMFLAGKKMQEWAPELEKILCRFARDHHCSAIELSGRRGWIRFMRQFGWEPLAISIVKDLRNE